MPTRRKKGGSLAPLLLATTLAAGGAWYFQEPLKEALVNKFSVAADPAPARIADAYLDQAAPQSAHGSRNRHALGPDGKLKIPEPEKQRIRDLIIKYESLPIEAGDAVKYHSEDFDSDIQRQYLRERVDALKGTGPGLRVAVAAVQEVELQARGKDGYLFGPVPAGAIEYRIRNRKFIDTYGPLTREQAAELAPRYKRDPFESEAEHVESIRRNVTLLDYEIERGDMFRRGLVRYSIARTHAIALAREQGRTFSLSALMPPAGPSGP